MGKHTLQRVLELKSEQANMQPEEMANILELPLHKVKKAYLRINKDEKNLI